MKGLMAQTNKVLIGIQARSTSKRFPRKSFADLCGRTVLEHVIDSCQQAARYINRYAYKEHTFVEVAVLCPKGDEIATVMGPRVNIIEGSEDDVLSRYFTAGKTFASNYIVRVTADCPLIPPYLITKHIQSAVKNMHDYISNVDERFRTGFDGMDCEVISTRALEWLDETATEKSDREHVTTLIRRSPPKWASIGHVIGFLDTSSMKLSVDTPEDLERVRDQYEKIKIAVETAQRLSGPKSVYRF